jgi:hypothetical protein
MTVAYFGCFRVKNKTGKAGWKMFESGEVFFKFEQPAHQSALMN